MWYISLHPEQWHRPPDHLDIHHKEPVSTQKPLWNTRVLLSSLLQLVPQHRTTHNCLVLVLLPSAIPCACPGWDGLPSPIKTHQPSGYQECKCSKRTTSTASYCITGIWTRSDQCPCVNKRDDYTALMRPLQQPEWSRCTSHQGESTLQVRRCCLCRGGAEQ